MTLPIAGSNRDYTINSNVLNSTKCNRRNISEVQWEQKDGTTWRWKILKCTQGAPIVVKTEKYGEVV